jgi:DNA-binding CsgD family transcriptional regulator
MTRVSMLFNNSAGRDFPNFQLAPGQSVFGRSPGCTCVVNDGSVSRRHAHLTLGDGSLTVRDLGSSNGTFLNGKPVASCTVNSGQEVRFGKVTFIYLTWEAARLNLGSEEETDKCADLEESVNPMEMHLSDAQKLVFKEVLGGFDEKEIAKRVHRSPHTVHNHLKVIYHVFRVHSRRELLAKVLGMTEKTFNSFS